MNFLAYLAAIFSPLINDLWVRLQNVFTTIIEDLTQDEGQIIHDAIDAFNADVKAGKSVSEAAADALNVFFNEEKGEVSKIAQAAFNLFLAKAGA